MKKNYFQFLSLKIMLLVLFSYLGVSSSLQAQCDFERTTAGQEDYMIPAGVTEITVESIGAEGARSTGAFPGGSGGTVTATFAVTPGDIIRFIVGEGGIRNSNGGGGGGGSTAVINCGSSAANCDMGNGTVLLIAGGGGGAGLEIGKGATTVLGDGEGGAAGSGNAGGGGGLNSAGGGGSLGGATASQNVTFTSRASEGYSQGGLGTGIGARGGGGGGYTGGDGAPGNNQAGFGGSNFIFASGVNISNMAGTDGASAGIANDGSVCITDQISGLAVTLTASSINCFGDNVTYTASATGATNYDFFLDANRNGQVDSGESLQSGASNTYVSNTILVGDLLSVSATDGSLTGRATVASPTPSDSVDPVFTACLGSYSDNLNVCDEYILDAATLGITATDNCGDVSITFSPAMLTGTGTTSVTATATDLSGNTATCIFDLTLSTNPNKLTITANDDVFNTDQFVPVTFTDADLLGNDSSTPMGLTLEVEEVILLDPSQGTLSEIDATTYSFVPAGGFTGTANLTYTVKVQNGASFFEDNDHFYEIVGDGTSNFSWIEARDSSIKKMLGGLPGYLATITSAEEQAFITSLTSERAWIGASDADTEEDWRWVTGPEGQANSGAGTPFWLGNASGSPVNSAYENWTKSNGTTVEPNNLMAGGGADGEDYGLINYSETGGWNDFPLINDLKYFVVEYGGVDGCNPNITAQANISINVQPDANTGFITTWKTSVQDPSITIYTDPAFTYNFTVDWGDGTSDMNVSGTISHTYSDHTVLHTVKIGGTFPHFLADNASVDPSNAWQIESIDQWGNIQWESMLRAFNNGLNMKYNAVDAPDLSNCTIMNFMFANCFQLDENTDLSNWNVSNIEDFTFMFLNANQFNGDIDNWDLSGALITKGMFQFARSFNRDIGGWNMSTVTDMRAMFNGADVFNQDIGNWNVSSATDMIDMFSAAVAFNQDISTWERTTPTVSTLANLIDTRSMFAGATAFNQDIGNWNVSSVRDMKGMFFNASSFDQDLGSWDLSGLNNNLPLLRFLSNAGMSTSNYDATLIGWAAQSNFPSNISPVGVNGLTYCAGRDSRQQLIDDKGWFFSGDAIDESACGDLPFITTWTTTSDDPTIRIYAVPPPGSTYNVDWGDGTSDMNLTDTIFHAYTDHSTPHTVKITASKLSFTPAGRILLFGFLITNDVDNAKQLKSIEQWGSIQWTRVDFLAAENMEYNATDIPDLSQVTILASLFRSNKKLNPDASARLNQWDVSKVKTMSRAFSSASLFNADISRWDVSNVDNMESMFASASSFNQPLDAWEKSTSNVVNMNRMFERATSFNQPIGNWDVSSVQAMRRMFTNASSFNQPLNSWTTPSLIAIDDIFASAISFNQPIDNWDVSNVIRLRRIFSNASSFNQDLGNWKLDGLIPTPSPFSKKHERAFDGTGVDITNYDNTLIGWANNPNIASNIRIGVGGLIYSCNDGKPARDILIAKGWAFLGDAPATTCLNDEDDIEERSEKALTDTALSIHPNPASGQINILLSSTRANSTLIIRDQLGRVLLSQPVGTDQDQLQLNLEENTFPAGMYWVSLDTGKEIVTEKLIIVK